MADVSAGYRKTYHLNLVLNEEECVAFLNMLEEHSDERVKNSCTNRPGYQQDDRLFYCIYCQLQGLRR